MRNIYRQNRIITKEASEQVILFRYFAHYPEIYKNMFAIPNGGSRHPLEALNLKRQGVKAGVPDIFLAIPQGNYHGLFIELKRSIKPAPVSKEQKQQIALLIAQGYKVLVSIGWVKAANDIFYYLNRPERIK